jgi:hypothetical protein
MFRPCLVCNTVSGTVKGNYSNTRSCLSTTDGPLHCTAPTICYTSRRCRGPSSTRSREPFTLINQCPHHTTRAVFAISYGDYPETEPTCRAKLLPRNATTGSTVTAPEHPIRSYPTGKKAVPSKRLCRQGSYMSAYQPLLQQHGQIWNRNFRSISLCKLRHGLWGVTNPAAENT